MKRDQIIKSLSNEKIKQTRKLIQDKKYRDKKRLFVAEGLRVIKELGCTENPVEIICSEHFYNSARPEMRDWVSDRQKPNFIVVKDRVYARLSTLVHAEGILGIFKKRTFHFDIVQRRTQAVLVLCEDIQDPTNIGAIIRSCFCLGADALLLTKGSVDIYNPKVVRASAGYILRLPILYINGDNIAALRQYADTVLVSTVRQTIKSRSLGEINNLAGKILLVFGNEARGVSSRLAENADELFFVRMHDQGESLNVSASVAISLFALVPVVKGDRWCHNNQLPQ